MDVHPSAVAGADGVAPSAGCCPALVRWWQVTWCCTSFVSCCMAYGVVVASHVVLHVLLYRVVSRRRRSPVLTLPSLASPRPCVWTRK